MLGGFELRYLASVAEGNDYPAAMRSIPWPVRSMAASRARRRVSEVMLASSYADDARHVHRVAYLRLVDHEPPNHDDKVGIEKAFAQHTSTDLAHFEKIVRVNLIGTYNVIAQASSLSSQGLLLTLQFRAKHKVEIDQTALGTVKVDLAPDGGK